MLKTRQNKHHSKLPSLGEIVYIPSCLTEGEQKGIVIAFPLFDSPPYRNRFYSRGIHTCYVRLLKSGKVIRISGHYLVEK